MKLPGIIGFFSSPKKSVAAMVDMVIDRLNDKYRLDFEIKGSLKIVDLKPEDSPAKEIE